MSSSSSYLASSCNAYSCGNESISSSSYPFSPRPSKNNTRGFTPCSRYPDAYSTSAATKRNTGFTPSSLSVDAYSDERNTAAYYPKRNTSCDAYSAPRNVNAYSPSSYSNTPASAYDEPIERLTVGGGKKEMRNMDLEGRVREKKKDNGMKRWILKVVKNI